MKNIYGFLYSNSIWPCDLDPRPFDLDSVPYIKLHTYNEHANFEHPIRSWVMSNSILSHFHHMELSCTCVMSRDLSPGRGQKWSTFLKSLTAIYHFEGATTKIKLCDSRKIAFIPLWRQQNSQRMRSITWPLHRGPPKPYLTIFGPQIHHRYTTFMGLRWRLRVVYAWAFHVKAIDTIYLHYCNNAATVARTLQLSGAAAAAATVAALQQQY